MKKTTVLRPDAASTPRRSPAPMPGRQSANGQRMAQRVHSRALADALQQLVIAGLPHVDDDLTHSPMAQVQVHTPAGELIASFDLPKQLADTVTVAVRHSARGIGDDKAEPTEPTERSRTADAAPAGPALSVLPGGVA